MDRVLGQEPVVTFLRSRLRDPPHLLLTGPTGIGKTMLANAWIAEQLAAQGVPPEHRETMTLRMSSADDRGIAAIRQRLTDFVHAVRPVAKTVAWILLDDADNLPPVTQQALRRILELYAHQTRFCFVAQSAEHFLEPIQSRCVILACQPVDLVRHGPALAAREGTTVNTDTLAALCRGNARQFVLWCRAIRIGPPGILGTPPTAILDGLTRAVESRDLAGVTANVLELWKLGYSYEDCVAMLEAQAQAHSLPDQTVIQCCAEAHVLQILNRITTLDLIAALSGHASSQPLA